MNVKFYVSVGIGEGQEEIVELPGNGVFEERYEKYKLSAIINKMYCFLNNG